MSQQQPRKPEEEEEAIKYGDVFDVHGKLAEKPVATKDAAMMQMAENALLGETKKGCAAATLVSAAMKNEKAGFVGHEDVNVDSSVTVEETELAGKRIITESIDNEVIGKYIQAAPLTSGPYSSCEHSEDEGGSGPITIGEALEATVLTAGNKPVEWSDAAAIQAAEVKATGRTSIMPGGVAAAAQSAATLNARASTEEEKTKLCDVLANATERLGSDKAATRKDAEGVAVAELRNDPILTTHPAGVSASVAAAARLNDQNFK